MNEYRNKIRQLLPGFNPVERRIAEQFLSSQEELFRLPIREIAEKCGCSQSAIVRFCQMLGYSGFKDFKREITATLINQYSKPPKNAEQYADIRIDGDLSSIVERITENAVISIRDTARVLDKTALEKAIHTLDTADRIVFFGIATSGSVAGDACQRFARLGKNCQHFSDVHMQLSVAATLKKGDAAVLISYSGKTPLIVRLMKLFRESGVTTIAITKNEKSPLSRDCDIVLSMLSTDIPVRTASLSTRISQLVVVDMLFTGVASLHIDTLEPILEKSSELCSGEGRGSSQRKNSGSNGR